MRVHLPGLLHTDTLSVVWDHCAFTTKIRHLATMLQSQGHDVIVYGSEHTDLPLTSGSEHVVCITDAMRDSWFGGPWPRDKVMDRWDVTSPCWDESNAAIIKEMTPRVEPGDLIALPIGSVHSDIARAFPDNISFESGVGYEGSWLPHRVFESHAWMHHTYGRQGINDGRYYDTVIPNAVDPGSFTFSSTPDDYILFLGRHIARKGLEVVREVAKHHRVITAGQDGPLPGVEYAGTVRGADRANLIANARVLLAPTQYIEPWGGVVVEAQISGIPVIASPWGGFTENIEEGFTGYLPHSLGGILTAISDCDWLNRADIRDHAISRYSLTAIAPLYSAYLDHLATLHSAGWYA